MRTLLCLFTALFLFISQTALADKIYRWTDADGQTHFGSQPPEQIRNAQELNLRVQQPSASTANVADSSPSSTDSDQSNKDPEQAAEQANADQPEPAKPTIAPEVAARNCRIAKEQLEQLSVNFSRRYSQADGTVRPLTDAERAAKTQQMNEAIQKYCK